MSVYINFIDSMWKPPSAIWATCFRMVVVAITLLLLAVVRPGASSESCCQFSLQSTSLSRYAARCSQLAFGQLWWHGNGPTKKWIFKSISTNWQWHKFIFIGGSSMPWWNREVIQRNGWKVIKHLVENHQTRVFATFEQGQPTKFVEQTSDRSVWR